VDWIVSNYVLECTIKETEALIEQRKKMSTDVLELEIKVQLLNLQMARIIEMVSTGQLTMEVYVQMIKNKIEEEKNLARDSQAKGQKVKAAEALKRVQWMEEEISGA
jgi:hypothetical protein